jgi:DNA-dependent RNA polymerase auxiliary subunit epsilon
MICTVYSHYIGFDRIVEILKQNYPKANLTLGNQDEFHSAELEIKGGLLSSSSKIKIGYRQRQKPSYQLLQEDVCPLAQNLKGLYGFIDSLPASNENIKGLFLQKITTINCEFSIIQEQGQTKDLKDLIHSISQEFDAFLFVQPNTIISRSNGQHLLDKNLKLIIDGQGSCEITQLDIKVEAKYFESDQISVFDDQRIRRQKSEIVCTEKNVPIYKNPNSLFVESDTTVKIRTKDEVVDRAISLCYLELKSESTERELLANFDKKYNVKSKLTQSEKQFVENENPTEHEIANANWKAESFHTLLWALSVIDNLKFPNELCNIGVDVGYLFSKSEQEFRDSVKLRSKEEILDQADLILRLNWACVNARVKNEPTPSGLNPSVIYERHYALNWLIHFQNQDWDNVTTNT